jgi:hypothetical protein
VVFGDDDCESGDRVVLQSEERVRGLGAHFSIRDLKEEKQPASSNQMAALVAYESAGRMDDTPFPAITVVTSARA